MRLEERYNIRHLCTDEYSVYKKYKIAQHHIASKSETCLAESKNSVIRRCLARFNRRTCRFSKAVDMIEASLLLLFNKDLLESIFN